MVEIDMQTIHVPASVQAALEAVSRYIQPGIAPAAGWHVPICDNFVWYSEIRFGEILQTTRGISQAGVTTLARTVYFYHGSNCVVTVSLSGRRQVFDDGRRPVTTWWVQDLTYAVDWNNPSSTTTMARRHLDLRVHEEVDQPEDEDVPAT